ncbi:MAG: hypothetical protein U9R68_01145 [Planctomycetota bacterium]|nr:hypothetical protein [Planctomycetota bacterium]
MTRKQALVLIPIGAVLAAGVVVAHLFLPTASASWTVNRVLHHACEAVAGLAAAGGVVWIMWPRPKPRRRDVHREQARRRVIALVGVIVAAVGLAIFAEMHRESASRASLTAAAFDDLRAVGAALDAYAADHGGDRPEDITALSPKYLDRGALYYRYRLGPAEAPPPEADDGQDAEPTTYVLARTLPRRDDKPPSDPVRAYLRPGHAWAPLTVVLERGGRCRVVGDDCVAIFEARRKEGL